MDFTDATLVQLADENTRTALFDQTSLEHIVQATYNADLLTIEAPFTVVFERLELGFSVTPGANVEGGWQAAGAGQEAHLSVTGLGASPIQAHAYWHGGVVARVSHATSRVISVNTNWQNLLLIDPQIIDDLGALPDDPAVLENERRARLIALIQGGMHQPAALTDPILDAWLRRNNVSSVSHLLTYIARSQYPTTLQIAYSEPEPGPTSPLFLPVSAAIFIRPAGFSVAALLMETKALLDITRKAGLDPARDARLPVRHSVIAVWIVPESAFDDTDWTGADAGMSPQQQRQARRLAAATWLAGEGIGLVALPEA